MDYSLKIIDMDLDKVYNEDVVANNGLSRATDYLDYIIMNILILERTTQLVIINSIMPNLSSKLDPTDAGWIRDYYFQKVYIDTTQTFNIESAVLLKEICKKLLYNKYVYKNILSSYVPPEVVVDPEDGDDGGDPVVPPAPVTGDDDSTRYYYGIVMVLEPNEEPAIDPDFIGVQQEVILTDRYVIDYPVLPNLPATADGELPVYYKDTYFEALRAFTKTIAMNTVRQTHNVTNLTFIVL